MLDTEFSHLAHKLLLQIADTIEEQDNDGNIDVELNDSILKLVTQSTTFIINKNSAAKEIWLSSPISGPHHFAFTGQNWKTNAGVELFTLLTYELNIKFI